MFRKLLVVIFALGLFVPVTRASAVELCTCDGVITGTGCNVNKKLSFIFGQNVSVKDLLDQVSFSECPLSVVASSFINTGLNMTVTKESCVGLGASLSGEQSGFKYTVSCSIDSAGDESKAVQGTGTAENNINNFNKATPSSIPSTVNTQLINSSVSTGGSAAVVAPEFNPICWQEDECAAAREKVGVDVEKSGQGFFPGEEPCNKPGWGKCLPSGVVTTEIAFGGKTQFLHLGEFIKTNYNYAIGIAAILAVIMIIVAGVQWVTSGGNSESIGSAKKRIGGALVGLFIAYMSYVILNTINPALVGLRLPQVWLIRESKIVPEYCSDLPKGTLFAFAADNGLKVNAAASSDAMFIPLQNKELGCGKRFFIKGSGQATCTGTFCPGSPQICTPNYNTNLGYNCVAGNVAGIVKKAMMEPGCVDALGWEGWEADTVDIGETELWTVCADNDSTDLGRVGSISYNTLPNGDKIFNFTVDINKVKESQQDCISNHQGFRGMVLVLEMNEDCDPIDEDHFIGKGGVDLGDGQRVDAYGVIMTNSNTNNMKKFGKYKSQYYYTIEDLEKGIVANIDSNVIHDIDEDADRVIYDKYLQ